MSRRTAPLAFSLLLGLGACSGLQNNDQGVLQPQSVSGPCTVKKFYLIGLIAVQTQMQVAPGGTCTFTILNPALNIFPTAALITTRAGHGTALAGLAAGGRQATVTYTAAPGYTGGDDFTATLEPNDHAVSVHVSVGG